MGNTEVALSNKIGCFDAHLFPESKPQVVFCNSDSAYAASPGSTMQFGAQQLGTYPDSQASFATLFTGMQQLSGQLSFMYEMFSNNLASVKLEIDSLKRKYDDFEKLISQIESASLPFSPV
jgi:hypothetical protein